jgi:hypothetical protein
MDVGCRVIIPDLVCSGHTHKVLNLSHLIFKQNCKLLSCFHEATMPQVGILIPLIHTHVPRGGV